MSFEQLKFLVSKSLSHYFLFDIYEVCLPYKSLGIISI